MKLSSCFRFVLLVLLGTGSGAHLSAQTKDYFTPQSLPGSKLDFLTAQGNVHGDIGAKMSTLKASLLFQENWTARPGSSVRIGDTTLTDESGLALLYLADAAGEDWITVYTYDPEKIEDSRREMWRAVGTYSGIQYFAACIFAKLLPQNRRSSVQLMALVGNTVINSGVTLPFALPENSEEATAEQLLAYEVAIDKLNARVDLLIDVLVPAGQKIYAARPDRPLTAAERTFGLVQFWTEAKYNFAYFDQVPSLDWDAALQEYLPLVAAEQTDAAYYRQLERFCALLEDGHTNVYPPAHLRKTQDRPRLKIELVGGHPVAVNRATEIGEMVPLGARIVEVAGEAVSSYQEREIFPYIAAGSDHVRRRWAAHDLLKGAAGTQVQFSFLSPGGERGTADLKRDRSSGQVNWEVNEESKPLTSFSMLEGDIGYLSFTSFGNERALDEFYAYLPEIKKCQGLVIDLRENGGGNSSVGYGVLEYFLDRPVLTSAWRTREHRAANRAWGRPYANEDPTVLSDWNRTNRETYLGETWYIADPDTIFPSAENLPKLPVAVLVSNYTASAAEDFLVAADPLENFTFVGEPSFGSTGQPLMLLLPGGGSARVCTKRDTYADGRVFVGPGVQVDVAVAPTVEEFLAKRDVALERALTLIGDK